MFKTYLCAAFVIGAISVASVCGIESYLKVQEATATAMVDAHSDILNGMIKNNAETMCPDVPKDPFYADLRTIYQCERFGL